jgi:ferredoxin, 2Fe-2S
MATLTVVPGDKTAEVGEGTTLLAALQGLGIKLATSDCGGNAQCGTCHIFVQEGRKGISKTTKAENEKLDTIVGVGSKSRLACQAKVLGTENIKVEILGFDSGR